MADTFEAYINELVALVDASGEPITGSMRRDIQLVEIQLDPAEARTHPQLYSEDRAAIETDIDAIFTAAEEGNAYANLLVHKAAQLSVQAATSEAINTFGNECFSVEYALRLYESDALWHSRDTEPIQTITETLAWLDSLIATAEVEQEAMQVAAAS